MFLLITVIIILSTLTGAILNSIHSNTQSTTIRVHNRAIQHKIDSTLRTDFQDRKSYYSYLQWLETKKR